VKSMKGPHHGSPTLLKKELYNGKESHRFY
jgi:hypothetical protein